LTGLFGYKGHSIIRPVIKTTIFLVKRMGCLISGTSLCLLHACINLQHVTCTLDLFSSPLVACHLTVNNLVQNSGK